MKKKEEKHGSSGQFHLRSLSIVAFIAILFSLSSCKDEENTLQYDPGLPVSVTDVIPSTGGVALPVVIAGNNFGTDKEKIKVTFNNKEAVIITAKNDYLYVLVPKLSAGANEIKVIVDDKNEGALRDKQFDYIVTSSVTTVGGSGERGATYGNALEAKLYAPIYLSIDDKGNIIINDDSDNIKLLSLEAGVISTLLPNINSVYACKFSRDFKNCYVAIESSSQTRLAYNFSRDANWSVDLILNTDNAIDDPIAALTTDEQDNLFMVGYSNGTIGRVDRQTGKITTIGKLPWAGEDFNIEYNLKDRMIYVSSYKKHAIGRFDPHKTNITEADFEVFAGIVGISGFNNGERKSAMFQGPRGIAFDPDGNLYIADRDNHTIRKIDTEGVVTTFAGGNGQGFKDGEVSTSMFNYPSDVTSSPEGIIYVTDRENYRIRCIAVQ